MDTHVVAIKKINDWRNLSFVFDFLKNIVIFVCPLVGINTESVSVSLQSNLDNSFRMGMTATLSRGYIMGFCPHYSRKCEQNHSCPFLGSPEPDCRMRTKGPHFLLYKISAFGSAEHVKKIINCSKI